jgi:ATP synthase protein I
MAEDDDERLRSNLDRLKSSLSKARDTQQVRAPPGAQASDAPRGDSGMSLGLRAGSEFVSSVVIGAGLGWGLDRLLGTRPLFLIALFFLGVAAGVWNVIRLTSPKGGGLGLDSPLSHTNAADKGLRRSAPAAEPNASQRLGASRGADEPSDGADDDDEG